MPAIDRTRPLTQILSREGSVIMYLDDPGIYYTPDGCVCSSTLARALGMNVDEHLKQRKVRELRLKHAEELAKFEAGLTAEHQEKTEAMLEGVSQKVDRSAYPNLEPMEFDEKGRLRETKSLVIREIDKDKYAVVVKGTEEMIAAPVSGSAAVREMLSWHEDHPDETANSAKGAPPTKDEIDDLFSDTTSPIVGGE